MPPQEDWPICVLSDAELQQVSLEQVEINPLRRCREVEYCGLAEYRAVARSGLPIHLQIPFVANESFVAVSNMLEVRHNLVLLNGRSPVPDMITVAKLLAMALKLDPPWTTWVVNRTALGPMGG